MSDTWLTGAEATTVTGKTVSDSDVAVAMPIIEIFSGVTTAVASRLKAKDLRMLRYATAYQAVWMKPNPGVLTGMDVQSASQDAVSFTRFTEGNDDAFLLAPLASRCLQRLSWRKTKTVDSLSPWDYVDAIKNGSTYDVDDDRNDVPWRPLGGG
jgi:hypothetical protein